MNNSKKKETKDNGKNGKRGFMSKILYEYVGV